MIVKQTSNLEEVKSILIDPDIYARITEDGAPESIDYIVPKNVIYIVDEKSRALMIYHWLSDWCLQCHVQVIPRHRSIAYDFGQAALKWAWDNTEAVKIVAQIPEIYEDVLKFAEKSGFILEGINERSYVKNGNIYAQVYLGLCRPEV